MALAFAVGGSHGAPLGAYTTDGTYSYVSAPALHPPVIRATIPTASSKLAPGYIFTANFYDLNHPPMIGQSGPLILDNRPPAGLVHPVPTDDVAGNLSLQMYDGKPVLAWWQGVITNTGATESGEDVIVDQHYRPVATLKATNGWVLTLHELVIRGHDAWVTANKNVPMNLSKYGGAYNGALIDSAVQEYDLKTGKLIHSWDALDHIPLGDSRASLPTNGFPWDAYHVNSINLPGDGTFVVSMRNTWAAYKVNIATGAIEWTLGGRHSSFKLGKGADFQWQHDVVVYPGTPLVTLFDDHCCQITGGGTYVSPTGAVPRPRAQARPEHPHGHARRPVQPRRQLRLRVHGQHGAALERQRVRRLGLARRSSPSTTRPATCSSTRGCPAPDITYRATREPWVGRPLDPPAGSARASGGRTMVYASWNGATEVKSWRVLGGNGAGR